MVKPVVQGRISISTDLPAQCLEERDCLPSLSQGTVGECSLDPLPPLQEDTTDGRRQRSVWTVLVCLL